MILGIDPGTKGGAVIISEDREIIEVMDFNKTTPHERYDILNKYKKDITICYIEKISSWGLSDLQRIKAIIKLNKEYGIILGILYSVGIPLNHVTPQTWQKRMGCTALPQKTKKQSLQLRAQELFPNRKKITQNICDALLIAEYGRLVERTK